MAIFVLLLSCVRAPPTPAPRAAPTEIAPVGAAPSPAYGDPDPCVAACREQNMARAVSWEVIAADCRLQCAGALDGGVVPFFAAVSVADLDRSVDWYAQILGFEAGEIAALPERGFRVVLLRRPGALLELAELAEARAPAELEPPIPARQRLHGPFKLGFLVADLDATIARLDALGVPLRGKVITEADGSLRSLQIEDPDGVVIQLFERLDGSGPPDGAP